MYTLSKMSKTIFLVALVFSFISCTSESPEQGEGARTFKTLDTQTLNQVLETEGQTQDGSYKVKIPQNDLQLMVDGFRIVPPMGATSWIAFTPTQEGARIFGDVVLKEEEVEPVEQVLFANGLYATALHKHFEGESPRVMFMHVGGSGAPKTLAEGVRAVLDTIESLRGGDPSKALSAPVTNTLDTEAISDIIGHEGSVSEGVFKISIGRPQIEPDIVSGGQQEYPEEEDEEHEESEDQETGGVHVTAFTGFNSWAAFQGTPDKAAVTGDIAMLAEEVPAVMKTLVDNGFKVVSLHNHMLYEHPRIFFLHYWGTGPAKNLARGLREALDKTGAAG